MGYELNVIVEHGEGEYHLIGQRKYEADVVVLGY
jgi:hypothetical protein